MAIGGEAGHGHRRLEDAAHGVDRSTVGSGAAL